MDGPMMSRSRQLPALLVAFCAALVLAGACGGDDEPDADRQPTTTAPSTTASPEAADEAALRQLAEDWYEAVEAIYVGDREPEAAADYISDPYLSGFTEQVDQFKRSGRQAQITGESSHEIRSIIVEGDEATLIECVIDADVLLDADGSVLNDVVQANLYSTDAQRVDGGWRLTERETLAEEDGETSCPEE